MASNIHPTAARLIITSANQGAGKKDKQFHPTMSDIKPLKIPIGILHPASMQARQARLTRKRNIQIRVTCSIALLLALASIVQYALLSSANHQKNFQLSTGRSQAAPKSEVRLPPPAAKPLQPLLGKNENSGPGVPVSQPGGIPNANGGPSGPTNLPGDNTGLLSPAETNPIR